MSLLVLVLFSLGGWCLFCLRFVCFVGWIEYVCYVYCFSGGGVTCWFDICLGCLRVVIAGWFYVCVFDDYVDLTLDWGCLLLF